MSVKQWNGGWMFWCVILIAAAARLFALDTLPPGILYDASSNGVSVLNILYNGERPFFINYMGAPEPLILYLQAVSVWGLGATPLALRLVTAIASILSVAALYGCALEFTRDRRVALVAAFALAVSMELFHFARFGQRATLVPLVEPALLYFAWRGWRGGATRDFAISGLVLGLSLYTYLSALMLPVILLVLWGHQFVVARSLWTVRLKPALLLAAIALFIALPRLVFQLAYPAAAFLRAGQVSLLQNPAVQEIGLMGVVAQRLLEYVRMFGIDWQGGSFKQPLFNPFLFAFFVVGLVVSLARWKKIETFWGPVALALMFLPDLMGANEPIPNRYRTVGIIPPAFFLVGVGAAALLDALKRLPWVYRMGGPLLAVVLGLSAVNAGWTYFVDYPAGRSTNHETDGFFQSGIEVAEAAWIDRQTDPVYMPLNEFARPPAHYLIGARAPRLRSALRADGTLDPAASAMDGWVLLPVNAARPRTEGLIYVHDPAAYVRVAGDTVYLLPPVPGNQPAVEAQLASRAPDQVIRDATGDIVANAYRVRASDGFFPYAPTAPQPIRFSKGFALERGALDRARVQPGESIPLSLYWSTAQATADNYAIFVHLLNVRGEVVANADVLPALNAYPTNLWKLGEVIPTHHQVKVPARTPPGLYRIEIGLYNALDGSRLSVVDVQGREADSRIVIGAVQVAPRVAIAYNPTHAAHANFGGQMMLTGYDVTQVNAPRTYRVVLYWRALAKMTRDEQLFVHVVDEQDGIVAQADHAPQNGNYPTSLWEVGETVADEFTLTVPDAAAPGRYRIKLGWYDLETGVRLANLDAEGAQPVDHVILDAPLEVGP